ncbi:Thioredoxin superfamily protein [Perilla frutescens var. hirtella]|uniref:Thioredoxin superfamily protein n=1 Tax=Perilla frutescens var. hirtella TaxID=608512 RepID=A0AAD4NVW2_PERFH|nr:Thioredoxin superfamily protein [Perilla frutescens var. hirtella]KAH6770633.1 Thioredoxin superfamily protein [Perilla frutescens var. hirtella]KAH6815747.1 Thioredoxin superfamily protein [Perilla frutescens var. frutescens]
MGSLFSSAQKREDIDMALAKAKQIVSSNPVVVFSKTYCGFCTRVKKLLSELQATHKVIELDEEGDGDEIQTGLHEWTGQRTVPNVFINGKHIGGSDVVIGKHQQGQLVPLLVEAGAIPKQTMHS